jgi:hypothetical protein
MREYRLKTKDQYEEALCISSKPSTEEKDSGKHDHALTSHERSHKDLVREDESEKLQAQREESPTKHRRGKQKIESQYSIREKMREIRKNPNVVETSPYAFIDPCPASMRHLSVREFSASEISWKMMTAFRPMDNKDEDIFSRF